MRDDSVEQANPKGATMTDHHPGHEDHSHEGKASHEAEHTHEQEHGTESSRDERRTEDRSHDREHDREAPSNKWVKDAEEALAGTGEAIRTAWDASRDARMNALEAARNAVEALGDAIEQGISAARARKQETTETEADAADTPRTDDEE